MPKSTLSTDGRQLTVIARAADQTAVQSLIDQLTEATAAQQKPTLKVYPLDEYSDRHRRGEAAVAGSQREGHALDRRPPIERGGHREGSNGSQ